MARNDIPSDITAAGVRPACITEMFDNGIPGEWGAVGSGQDVQGISTWYRYLRALRLLANLCATVLAGWKVPPFGQLERGPVVATIAAVVGMDATAFELYIDIVFFPSMAVALLHYSEEAVFGSCCTLQPHTKVGVIELYCGNISMSSSAFLRSLCSNVYQARYDSGEYYY